MNDKSKLILFVLVVSIVISFFAMYYNFIVLKNYVTFTDPNTVPSPTDFFGYIASLFHK